MTSTPSKATAGQDLYARANDARRSGDHDAYNRLCLELIAHNARRAAISRAKGEA